jgi:hypothetical protein
MSQSTAIVIAGRPAATSQEGTNLFSADADVLLGELDVHANAELVDQRDAGDGRHGRDLQPVGDHVRHHALDVPAGLVRRRALSSGTARARRHERHLGGHGLHAKRALGRRLHGGGGAVPGAREHPEPGERRRRVLAVSLLEQQQLAGVRVQDLGLEQVRLVGAGLQVGPAHAVHALVQAPDAAVHRARGDELRHGADGQRQQAVDEVHELLAGLREQHPVRLGVHQQLQRDLTGRHA